SLKLDTTLPKYYCREFTVRGTRGYAMQENNMVILEGDRNTHLPAHDSAKDYDAYLPDIWRNITEEQLRLGHGGMAYLEFVEFFKALRGEREMPIDVYDAASWMAVTVLSEHSIAQGGAPQAIPDFTNGKWITRENVDVVPLPNPNV
ncbi:MAG: gfo/Idh/MocA family oxidoreductase, partial [Clostridia bacterium]|nr:gfo/Idh/MocA family oxidoreductase [Clostridia bacterium]